MPKYKIQICRTYYAFADMIVDASNRNDAEKVALKNPPDDFHGMQIAEKDEIVFCDKIKKEK